MTRPRVLVITQHAYPFHPTVRRNVETILDAGASVDLLCTSSASVPDWDGGRPGLRVRRVRIDHRRGSRLRYLLEFAAFFGWALGEATLLSLRGRYRAVLVDNLPDPLVFSAALARLRGARLVFEMFELTPEMAASRLGLPRQHPLVAIAHRLEGWATGWADRVIVVNKGCADALERRGVSRQKLVVVPNSPPAVPGLDWAPPASPPVLVTHCSLIPRYGVHVAIEALARLAPLWPGIRLRVLGEGEERDRLLALAERLGVASSLRLEPWRPWAEAMREITKANVGIVAVIDDGYGHLLLPTKLLEYAAHGVPVACARLPTIARHFPADSVSYFQPGDPADLARQVDRLLRDPAATAAQAERARAALIELSWERAGPAFLAALGLSGGAAAQPYAVTGNAAAPNRS